MAAIANISYVFTVKPGRTNRYRVQAASVEVKALAATGLEVWVVDASASPATEALITRDNIKLGTSVIVGGNVSLEFSNPGRRTRNGYIGGVV